MDTNALKAELQQRLTALGIHRDKLKAHLRKPGHADWQEQATQRENDEVLEALEDKDIAEHKLLEDAIARIDEGKFGICTNCHGEIAEARLKAIPWATVCVNCAD